MPSSLSDQGVSDFSESSNEVAGFDDSLSGNDDAGGCGRSRDGGVVVVLVCVEWFGVGGGSRVEELGEVLVGLVASGKLGKSRCEDFRI